MIPSHWTRVGPSLEGRIRIGKATFLHQVFGYQFFEHPDYGDEAPILAMDKVGRVYNTNDYDLPEYL